MKRLNFSIQINAPREKVWHTMLDDATYREWTRSFNDGSYFVGDWSEGSKMLFLGPDPSGNGEGGMIARVRSNKPNEYLGLEHYGMVNNGVEDTTSEEVKKWTPAQENYIFTDSDGGTKLDIELDTVEEYEEMFNDMWPKSLQTLKELAEK